MEQLTDDLLTRRVLEHLRLLEEKTGTIYQYLPLEFGACRAENRWIELTHRASPFAANPSGTLHGGVIAWLLDTTMAVACRSFSGAAFVPTLDLCVNFLGKIEMGTTVVVRAEVKRMGGRVIQLYGEVRQAHTGALCATATANSYIARP